MNQMIKFRENEKNSKKNVDGIRPRTREKRAMRLGEERYRHADHTDSRRNSYQRIRKVLLREEESKSRALWTRNQKRLANDK